MAANVETMFYTREKPWHGLGTRVEEAPTSVDALRLAGLDWEVQPFGDDELSKEVAAFVDVQLKGIENLDDILP